jgi:hypothetical protein
MTVPLAGAADLAGGAGGAGRAEVAAKLDRVRGWLAGSGYGAALFTSQPGVASPEATCWPWWSAYGGA